MCKAQCELLIGSLAASPTALAARGMAVPIGSSWTNDSKRSSLAATARL
jgi:hypothetical protein